LKYRHPLSYETSPDQGYLVAPVLELAPGFEGFPAAAFGAALALAALLGLAALSLALKRALESSNLSRAIAPYFSTCDGWEQDVT